jgi:hypothetical protein
METNKTVSIRVSETSLKKVKKHVKKTKQSIGGFYDLAAVEKIKKDNQIK